MPCSSVRRYATFSFTLRESKRALSWKTIPILPRSWNSSFSFICVTSWPSTIMRPESGRISPRHIFRIKLFPEPATPNRTLVSPRARRKETPRSTFISPKEIATSSKTMAGAESFFAVTAAESSGKVGADMGLVIGQCSHQESGNEQVSCQDQDGSCDHGLGGGAAHALGSAASVHAIEAAYGGDDEAEDNRLDQPHEHILKNQRLPGVVPVLPGVETQQHLGDKQASGQAHHVRNNSQEKHHENGGDHARRDQFLHGVGAQGAHGVDLFGHYHRSQLAGHAGGIPAGHHQTGQHWPQLAHHGS